MNTKERIIQLADELIRTKGCNAFSFGDISKALHIKNASIHYHFATKTALIIAVIQKHSRLLLKFKRRVAEEDPLEKVRLFLTTYTTARSDGKISILGALASDYLTLDEAIQLELKVLTDGTLQWLMETLKEGKEQGAFNYTSDPKSKAQMVITSILGAEQLSRVTFYHNFRQAKATIINDLINRKP
ncbi:TetR/AcrR family transcriptional regulator [Echinicola soli]|uniref:TetR/AcrR family transcriptional regulator n=1 Tax=Echinicola soli TaxID=2591634 RepID=A0A514CDI5_9BACT|nr:TetR/AcrR family transcriptional regulator [Echinicola soli]QDH77878.1 TetR/AcrR family transcriptional regulator [Echinicola soli]